LYVLDYIIYQLNDRITDDYQKTP